MTVAILDLEPQPVLASFRRHVSVHAPWHAQSAARRASRALCAQVDARAPRLRAALSRPRAANPVAAQRLFAAVRVALGEGVELRHHHAARHSAITAHALAPDAAGGIRADGLFCLAGKRRDQRMILPIFAASHHACARFVERSGHADPVALHSALLEAVEHVPAVLVAHLDGGLAYRLRGGTAAILLPAGEGAFLGRLRLLPLAEGAAPHPSIEICTWVHVADLASDQREAMDILCAGLPPAVLLDALPEAWWALGGNFGGDRRVQAGLAVAPFPPQADQQCRIALARCDWMSMARLDLGLACPESIAAERLTVG